MDEGNMLHVKINTEKMQGKLKKHKLNVEREKLI